MIYIPSQDYSYEEAKKIILDIVDDSTRPLYSDLALYARCKPSSVFKSIFGILDRLVANDDIEQKEIDDTSSDIQHDIENINIAIPFMIVSDKYPNIVEFTSAWLLVLTNFMKVIPDRGYDKLHKNVDVLINMLEAQNNYYRLINMSNYLLNKLEYITRNNSRIGGVSERFYKSLLIKEGMQNEDSSK